MAWARAAVCKLFVCALWWQGDGRVCGHAFLTWPSDGERDGLALVFLTSDVDRPGVERLPLHAFSCKAVPLDASLYGTSAHAHKGFAEYNE
jgi:hypothetical protein